MFVHPDIHLEIASQRLQDMLADAERDRLAISAPRRLRRSACVWTSRLAPKGNLHWEGELVAAAASHFGHREIGGIVVDLFWTRGIFGDEFRVEVEDRREGSHFVLFRSTGREAIQAFHHPFAAKNALNGKARAA
jgi:hypothetical protein